MKYSRVLIDGDILIYRACCPNQVDKYVVSDPEGFLHVGGWMSLREARECVRTDSNLSIHKITFTSPLFLSKSNIDNMVRRIKRDLEVDKYSVYLTGPGNFREHVAVTKPYKGNRTQDKPKQYDAIKQYLIDEHKAKLIEGCEADDALGFLQTEDTVIASLDKDLMMIPGYHYNLISGEVIHVSDPGTLTLAKNTSGNWKLTGTGFKWFCAQMFLGDAIDNIKGLDRYGPKKAYEVLKDRFTYRDLWAAVKWHYYRQGQIHRLGETATLLWIWRCNEDIFHEQRIQSTKTIRSKS